VDFFPIILFGSTTVLTGLTGISFHMQWPLTSQLHGSVSQGEQVFFSVRIKLHALGPMLCFFKYFLPNIFAKKWRF
jgi:hypothetical protein